MMQLQAKTYSSGAEMLNDYQGRYKRLRTAEVREPVVVPMPLPEAVPTPPMRRGGRVCTGTRADIHFDAHVLEWRVQKYLAEHNCHRYIAARAAQMGYLAEEICQTGCRKSHIAFSRQILMYEIRAKFKKSFPQIGRMFGGFDHTTCLHAYRKIERLIAEGKL